MTADIGGGDDNGGKSLEAVMILMMAVVCVLWVCEKIIFAFKTIAIEELKHFF